MPQPVSTPMLQAMVPSVAGFHTMRMGSLIQASGSVKSSAALNWMTWPVRRSKCGTKRFCSRVPALIPARASKASSTGTKASSAPASLCATTAATPMKPSSTPTRWRAVTRSPIHGAQAATSTGCRLTISATRPALMPWRTATQTPPR